MFNVNKRDSRDRNVSVWEKIAAKHYEWKSERKISVGAELMYLVIRALVSVVFRRIFDSLLDWVIN